MKFQRLAKEGLCYLIVRRAGTPALPVALVLFALIVLWRVSQPVASAQSQTNELEAALYQRVEFFGAQASLPLPANEARQRIAALQKRFPQDAAIQLKAAELDEILGHYEEAEAGLKRHTANRPEALHRLAEFYGRRAQFAQQAATLAELIERGEPSQLADNLGELLALARKQGLSPYLSAEFFQSTIARRLKDSDDEGKAVFTVIEQYLAALSEQKRWPELATAVHSYRAQLPEYDYQLLLVEINALEKQGKVKEAEAVYDAAFDPFWDEEKLRAFYWDFLSDNDRLRAYGQELRAAFRREPTRFNTALRLYAYRKEMEDRATAMRVFSQLEQARAQRGQQWADDELAIVARLLIAQNQAEAAARYLYTLAQRGSLQPGQPLRAEVLYQLFRLMTAYGDLRTPLTQGDLRFYEDVSKSDPHPGLLSGVLSFVLSDTNPGLHLKRAEDQATAYFNRATAWRLFEEYKRERPTSPQLAQMYVELIQLFTDGGDGACAGSLLKEFETRFADAPQRAEVALHLANYYQSQKQRESELAIYRDLLAHCSQRFKQSKAKSLRDVVEQRERTLLADEAPAPITYETILHRYVAALSRDNRTNDILTLYADAIKQHSDEAWLYEEFLTWLESVNLTERQLAVYQEALQRFPDTRWTDRLARWFVRRERQQDFERLSRTALEKFDETQTANYLAQHLSRAAVANAKAFDAQLYRALYQQAHERFPHSPVFVNGLLRYHEARNEWDAWRALLAEHYWESEEWREMYLRHLSQRGQLRAYLDTARARVKEPKDNATWRSYLRFQADAAAWLSQYEESLYAYRTLVAAYPQQREFADRIVLLSRSFGQQNAASLQEAAQTQQSLADANPADAATRTTAGELYAEQGDYPRAGREWNQLLRLGAQDETVWLETATLFWDYYQYDEALRVLRAWRRQRSDNTLYAFQIGAILDSQHRTTEALAEYVKALDQEGDDYYSVRKRLLTLARRKGVAQQLRAVWSQEATRSNAERREALTLGYVDLLTQLERWPEAASLMRRETARSVSSDFLESARNTFREHDDAAGELLALQRLTTHARTTRFAISYRLQLVEHAARQRKVNEAQRHLQQLVKSYPNNYGVVTEAANVAWQIGVRDLSLRILRQAQGRALGRYRYRLARQIAANESARGAWAAAEKVLVSLHDQDPRNLDVFAELARASVRTGHGEALRQRYRTTIQAIKEQDELDRLEQRDRIAEVREQVIEACTTLRDYDFAVEQHIEIINRNPDDEEKLEAALRYCQRYGGCEKLIDYYRRTAREAYKDYRWNLVLGRLHSARRDWSQAVTQYRQAVHNQPEMLELHEALADAAAQAQNFDEAINARRRACELTNDAPAQRIKLIETLERAGRKAEADKLRAQLPQTAPREMSVRQAFTQAAQLSRDKRNEAIAQYRQAFARFEQDFYRHQLSAADLQGYVETLRDQESLDQIAQRLWEVRERVQSEALRSGNARAAEAAALLSQLNRSLPEVLGRVAHEHATGDELNALRDRIRTWSQAKDSAEIRDARFALLSDLSTRSGLGDVAESMLIARKDELYGVSTDGELHHRAVQRLLDFYGERGAYERALTMLVAESERDKFAGKFDYARLIAEHARWLNDRPRELQALRQHFYSPADGKFAADDALVDRYLTLLHQGDEAERTSLRLLAQQPTPRHWQVANFLIRHREIEWARVAIESAPMPLLWKTTRQAELSLATQTFAPENEAAFLKALGWTPIGELMRQPNDAALQGKAWFTLAERYGRWLTLAEKGNVTTQGHSAQWLPALLELRPKDASEQVRLANWWLEQRQPHMADAAHAALQLALDANAQNLEARAALGTALYQLGQREAAHAEWAKLLETASVENAELYWRTLAANDQTATARATLQAILRKTIESDDNDGELKKWLPLLTQVAASFKAGEGAAAYFQHLLVSGDVFLASTLIRERMIARADYGKFYEWLIVHSTASADSDSSYTNLRRKHPDWSVAELEVALDHDTENESSESSEEDARLEWQKEYLNWLLAQRQHTAAAALARQIETYVQTRRPRPLWLRLASARLALRTNRINDARKQLEDFVGLTVHNRVKRLRAPASERLSEATALLKAEGFGREADALAQAAYERQLALNQVTMPSLLELARLAWQRNEPAQARQWLALLIKLGDEATQPAAQAELAALPVIKTRVVIDPLIETPKETCEIPLAEALRLAAEYSAAYAQYDDALRYRQRLLALHPADETTRLEIARLLAAKSQPQAAGEALAELLIDRQTLRATRWQAVWLADELEEKRGALWQALLARWQNAPRRDIEIQQALSALVQGQRISGVVGSATFQLWQAHGALPQLVAASVDDLGASAAWLVPELRWALIRSYAAQRQAGAALRLSERDMRLQTAVVDVVVLREAIAPEAESKVTGLLALPLRIERARVAERIAVFQALAQMSEQNKTFDRAAGFEAARLGLIADAAERESMLWRIEALLARAKQHRETQAQQLHYTLNDQPLALSYR